MYAALDAEAKGSVLAEAALALAKRRVISAMSAALQAVDPDAYVAGLAGRTFPWSDECGTLLSLAREAEMSADEALFPDGMCAVVLCASELLRSHAEGFYRAYENIRRNTDSMIGLPEPAAVLGVREPKTLDFQHWEDDGWVLDEEGLQAEVDRLCVERCLSAFCWWREQFFDALLSPQSTACQSG